MNGPVYAVKVYKTACSCGVNCCNFVTELIVGGKFTQAGNVAVQNIARWNSGTGTWDNLGGGFNGVVRAIEAVPRPGFGCDTSPDIYAGGDFTALIGGQQVKHIAKWNGANSTWSSLGTGVSSSSPAPGFLYPNVATVCCLRNVLGYLWVGGRFYGAGGVASPNIAQWNLSTSQWSGLGKNIVYHDGSRGSGPGIPGTFVMVTAIAPGGAGIVLCTNNLPASGDLTLADKEGFYTFDANTPPTFTASSTLRTANMRAVSTAASGFVAGHDQLIPVPGEPVSDEMKLACYSGDTELDSVSGGWTWHLLGGSGYDALPTTGNPYWPYGSYLPSGWKAIGGVNAILPVQTGDTYLGGCFTAISGACPGHNVANYSGIGNILKWTPALGCPNVGWSMLQNGSGGCGSVGAAAGVNGIVYAMDEDYNPCNSASFGIWVGGSFSLAGGLTVGNLAYWNGTYWSALSPPTVSVSNPLNGAVIPTPANITITASATGLCGISKVDFYQGQTPLGTAATYPYSCPWINVPAGSYVLTAKATDTQGYTTTSAGVSITVDNPPTVSITSPYNGQGFQDSASITITATAADVGGSIAKVEFYEDGISLGRDLTSPYSYPWNNVPTGVHVLTAKATDSHGTATTSAPVYVYVGIIKPPVGSAFTASSVNVNGVACGYITLPNGQTHAAVWNIAGSGTVTDLDQSGTFSVGEAINDAGTVVGYRDIGGGVYHAFKSAQGQTQPTDLHSEVAGPNFTGSVAYGINNKEEICGYIYNTAEQGFFLNGSGVTLLPTLGGSRMEPSGLNDSSLVVGSATVATTAMHAFRWQPGDGLTDLNGSFDVPNQWATAVSAQGDIAGYTALGEFYWAYVIQNGNFQDLSTGYWASWANALNSKHQVVGAWETASAYDERALYWHGSQSFDLNNSLPVNSGWVLNRGCFHQRKRAHCREWHLPGPGQRVRNRCAHTRELTDRCL